MKQIIANEFIKHWLEFSDTKTSDIGWIENLKSYSAWTRYILGTKSSKSDCSPIGEFYKKKYERLRYRTEDGLFDLGMTLHPNINKIATVNRNYEPNSYPINSFYPSIYDVLLEHENNLYTSWMEIAKLSYFRSFLKVLVTYYSEKCNQEQRQKENQLVIENFKNIIGLSCHEFPDNKETEYVLLIGWQEDHLLKWTSNIFDAGGNLKTI